MKKFFKLGTYEIEFNEEFVNYNNLRKRFLDLSIEAYEKFKVLYKSNCLNIDDVHNKAYELGCQCISSNIDEAVSIMISYGLMHIDRNGFIDNYYAKFFTWEDDFEKVDIRYREIVLTAEQEKDYREERKAERGRWQGGGFGLSGAIGGAMQAGAMNAVTGAAHSAFNFVGNMVTSVGMNSKKEKLFTDCSTMDDLAQGIMSNVFQIHYAVVDALICNDNNFVARYPDEKNIEMSKALLNNLKTGLIPKEKQEEIIRSSVYNNPYNEEIYLYLLKAFGDENRGLEHITEFLNLNIEEEINSFIEEYFNGLPKDTEEVTFKSLEEFKKFAESINVEDISKYLDEFERILKDHDINIRTVDGILFETREEAEIARSEYNDIMEIRKMVIANSEKTIKAAIEAIEAKSFKSIIKDKYLEELNKELEEAIRFEDQLFLNDNYSISAISTEEDADKAIEELKGLVLRSMDLVEKRVEEIKEKRSLIIEEADREFVDAYFNSIVILNERDVEREVRNIRNLNVRTEKVKEEKTNYVLLKAEKIIKKHNLLLEKALKYEIRMTSIKAEKKSDKKGVFGFISKAIEKGTNIIDELQEKSEKEAWNFITNDGERTIEEIINR